MGPSVENTYLYKTFGTLKGRDKADGKGGSGGKHGTLRSKYKYVFSIGLTRRMGVSMGPYVENTNLRIPYPPPPRPPYSRMGVRMGPSAGNTYLYSILSPPGLPTHVWG